MKRNYVWAGGCARMFTPLAPYSVAQYPWAMKHRYLLPVLLIAACEEIELASAPVVEEPVETLDPTPPPPPPRNARTVEQFDTTTAEDRAAAVATPAAATSTALGTTIASLGSPADPGIWIKTPLVSELSMGRVEYQGNAVTLELRPSGGPAGSGSQLSLAAMRLLEAPLTGLPEVTVFR